jgi:tight adherence protein C
MGIFIILIFVFISVFLIFIALSSSLENRSNSHKRVQSVIRDVRFTEKDQFANLAKIKQKVVHFKISDNIAYVYSLCIAGFVYYVLQYQLVEYFSDDLQALIPIIPFALFVFIPFFYKKYVNNQRTQEVLTVLPMIIDLLIICLEAGLSFSMSIEKIISEMQSKSKFLAKRFQLMVYELNAGIDKKTALKNLVERCYDHPDMKAFVSSIVQSESMGFSIVQTLRVQAEETRLKKRQMLRTRIARMPVTLLFPLVFCIFPITAYLLIGPGLMEIMKALK